MRIVVAAAVLFTTGAARLSAMDPAFPPINSPRLDALQKAIQGNESGALDAFWKEVKGKTPLVEPIPGTDAEVWATYLWRGGKDTERVDLIGGVPIAVAKELTRLPGTDLWYWTERTPQIGRFSYRFLVNRRLPAFGPRTAPTRNDPLAARSYAERSIAEMPGAPKQPWSDAKKGVPAGKRQAASVPSAKLKADRKVTIYTPAGYDTNAGEYDLLIVFDGEDSG